MGVGEGVRSREVGPHPRPPPVGEGRPHRASLPAGEEKAGAAPQTRLKAANVIQVFC
jgi:hypothetical protein